MQRHKLAGKAVSLKNQDPRSELFGISFVIEDYWINVAGVSWMFANGNPACLKYAIRTGFSKVPIPTDDNVIYGHDLLTGLGHLVHESEIGGVIT